MSFLLRPAQRTTVLTPHSLSPTLLHRPFSSSPSSKLARMTLVGRLGTDPELVENARGNPLIKYVLGTSSGPKDNKTTSWFRVACFPREGAQKDYIMGLSKGTLVYFEGDATMKLFEDAEGKKQSALNLVQTKLEVLKRPVAREEGGDESAGSS